MHSPWPDSGPTLPAILLFTRHMPKQLHSGYTTGSAKAYRYRVALLSIVRLSSSLCTSNKR
jgi:hypothetical protein